ncbi:MAG: PKD domain-containing protein, partial [Thermoplasmata archaeon]|nr:PKD domain-containing protein [Thermoplasmata archaeon]
MHATPLRPRGFPQRHSWLLIGAVLTLLLLSAFPSVGRSGVAISAPSPPQFHALAGAASPSPNVPSPAPASGSSSTGLATELTPTGATPGWANITSTAGQPAARSYGRSLAYDPVDGYLVMFGGYSYGGYLQDTWTFHNGVWTQLHPKTSPTGRDHSTLAWDPVDRYLVLFGGSGNGGSYADTWTFLGGNWTQLTETTHPSARWASSLTWDAHDSELLLFGGCVGGSAVGDTWTFLNGSWTLLHPIPSPSARENVALQYDPAINATLLFGGDDYYTAMYADTWTFSDGNWTQLHPPTSPTARTEAGSAYDPIIGAVVLFGGSSPSGTLGDTWWFSGGSWSSAALPVAPPSREFGELAYDPGSSYLVLFSGAGSTEFTDTWVYYQVALTATVSASSGVAPLDVAYDASVSGAQGAVQYAWNLGDGNFSTNASTEETLTLPGLYFVSVRATDGNGSSASASTTIDVVAPLAAIVVVAPTTGLIPLAVVCSAAALGGNAPYRYLWGDGSGNSSSSATPTFIYAVPGHYVASVTILDAVGASQVRSFNITAIGPTYAPLISGIEVSSLGGPAPWSVWFAA